MLSFLDKIRFGTPRLRRVAFWLVVAFVSYTLFGFLAGPPIIKSILIDQLSTNLHRTTHVGDVYFNPLRLSLEVEKLKIDKLKGEGELLSLDFLGVSPGVSSIWNFAPVISYLQLHNLKVDVTFFGKGDFSFSDLLAASPEEEEKPKEEETSGSFFPFALYGFEMTNSTIVFEDIPHKKRHVVSDLNLIVPFTSSFESLRKEFTQPVFTAVVNGDPIELKGRTLPFDETLRTEFNLGAVDFDLQKYREYIPLETPLKLENAQFTSDISLVFEVADSKNLSLFLEGGGKIKDIKLVAPDDGPVLTLDAISFEMEKFSLGDKQMILNKVALEKPYFKVIRHASNVINWAQYFPGSEMEKEGPKVKRVSADSADFVLDIRTLQVNAGKVDWVDKAVPGGFAHTFSNVNFEGTEISTEGDRPSRITASINDTGVVSLVGVATVKPLAVKATLAGKGINLTNYKPYIESAQPLLVDNGTLGFSAEIDFKGEQDAPVIVVNNAGLTLEKLRLRKPDAKAPSLALNTLSVNGTSVDINDKAVTVAGVFIDGPSASLVREKDGAIDLARLFASDAETLPAKPTEQPPRTAEGKPWAAAINSVRIQHGEFSLRDESLTNPASLGVREFALTAEDISTEAGAPLTYDLSADWGGKGRLSVQGKAVLDPISADGRLRLSGLGLRPLDNYLGQFTELLFASGSASADLRYSYTHGKDPKLSIKGTTALNSVRLKDNRGDGEFASIGKLELAGIDFATSPNRLIIGAITLDKPGASIDIDAKGQMNVRRLFRLPEPPPVPEEGKDDTGKKADAKKSGATKGAKAEEEKVAAEPAKPEEPPLFEVLDIGKVVMTGGRVRYRDASVKPTYFTELTDMNLTLVEVSQKPDARPKLDFKAKIGPTPMSVIGALNPVVTPIYSDLAISVNGMEMIPITPYTLEYLAYPVEKGRLYADVKFKTENWVLQADNKFFIEQFVLGPKDNRPNAPNVPVKFGMALLQDGNGDMELNLPIRGRLDDPDFRIGGIVFKAIVNLMFKALASPFSLIGSIFGGGEGDMDFVVFEPGLYQLDAGGDQKLQTVAKALGERKKLKLEVDGVIDPVTDHSGLIEAIFRHKLKQEKYDSLPRKERAETTVEEVEVMPEEYADVLYEVYADEPDPEGVKSTTLFVTDRQPIEVMEKFVMGQIVVTDEDLNELARQRASAVKDRILELDPTLTDRVFLLDKRKDREGKTGVPKHRADLGIK